MKEYIRRLVCLFIILVSIPTALVGFVFSFVIDLVMMSFSFICKDNYKPFWTVRDLWSESVGICCELLKKRPGENRICK